MKKIWNLTFCNSESEFPKIGKPCPKCEDGYIQRNFFGGVWCVYCKWKWKLSAYPENKNAVLVPKSS